MQFLSFDFEQVSAPAGFAAGGTSQCGLHYTRRVKVMRLLALHQVESYYR